MNLPVRLRRAAVPCVAGTLLVLGVAACGSSGQPAATQGRPASPPAQSAFHNLDGINGGIVVECTRPAHDLLYITAAGAGVATSEVDRGCSDGVPGAGIKEIGSFTNLDGINGGLLRACDTARGNLLYIVAAGSGVASALVPGGCAAGAAPSGDFTPVTPMHDVNGLNGGTMVVRDRGNGVRLFITAAGSGVSLAASAPSGNGLAH